MSVTHTVPQLLLVTKNTLALFGLQQWLVLWRSLNNCLWLRKFSWTASPHMKAAYICRAAKHGWVGGREVGRLSKGHRVKGHGHLASGCGRSLAPLAQTQPASICHRIMALKSITAQHSPPMPHPYRAVVLQVSGLAAELKLLELSWIFYLFHSRSVLKNHKRSSAVTREIWILNIDTVIWGSYSD